MAEIVGVSPAAVSQFENGYARPSAAALARIAVALDQNLDFFTKDLVALPNADRDRAFFRSLRSTRQIDRDQAQARVSLVAEFVDELRRHVSFPKLDLPDDLHVSEHASQRLVEQKAEELRLRWNIQVGPVAHMVRLLESKGVIVVKLSIHCSTVDSFSRWMDRQPLIVLDADEGLLDRFRFDAAHELGHLVLHQEPEAANKNLELQAHAFAAAFLMPRSDIVDLLPSRLDWPAFKDLKQTWGVSVSALLRRAKDLGRMSESTYRRGMIALSQAGERKRESSFPLYGSEEPVLLSKAVDLIIQGGVPIGELARKTCFREAFIHQVIAKKAALTPVISNETC